MKTRIIKTGLTSHDKKNTEVLQSIVGQLSDGIWENSPACTCYWWCADIGEHDHEVAIKVSEKWYERYGDRYMMNRYCGMTDAQILEYFARKITQIIDCFKKDYDKINVTDDTDVVYMGYTQIITVADAKRVRKILMDTAKNIKLLTTK